jgi:hypothetical protein
MVVHLHRGGLHRARSAGADCRRGTMGGGSAVPDRDWIPCVGHGDLAREGEVNGRNSPDDLAADCQSFLNDGSLNESPDAATVRADR